MKYDEHTKAYLEKLKSISLDASVRARMWKDLEAYTEFHGQHQEVVSGGVLQRLDGVAGLPAYVVSKGNVLNRIKVALLLALVVLGGGSSFAAQGSLPGDLLYPVKVGINERVQSAFTVGADNETKLQVAFLEERLREATELATRGKLTGDTARTVRTGIEAQTQKTLSVSESSTVTTQAEVRLGLDATLQDFGATLASLDSDIGMNLIADVQDDFGMTLAQADVSDHGSRTRALEKTETEESAGTMAMMTDDAVATFSMDTAMHMGKLASVDVLLEQLATRIEGMTMTLHAVLGIEVSVKAEVEKEIKSAKEFLEAARTNMKVGEEADARVNLDAGFLHIGNAEAALSLVGELIIDLETGSVIGIDLSLNGEGQGQSGSMGSIEPSPALIDSPIHSDGSTDFGSGL